MEVSFNFGGLNPQYATEDSQLTWTPLFDSSNNYWTVPFNGLILNSSPHGTNANYAIIDSGTSVILMTDEDYSTF